MSGARGIIVAGLVAIGVTGSHALYRVWPATAGTEICVPAALVNQPTDLGLVAVQLPFARIELDVPHTAPAAGDTFERVPRIGEWWTVGGDVTANARRFRGRSLYLQLTAGQPIWPGGPVEMRPSTVSDSAVAGATNLAGIVANLREDGYVWLDFSFGWIAVPKDVAAKARPFAPPRPRNDVTAPAPPATDPGVFAVLRVLPSGRAALVGVIVNGARY